jgi:NAD(P)H-nitrite reductase large subunit
MATFKFKNLKGVNDMDKNVNSINNSENVDRVLILGASIAGITAAGEIRKINPDCNITMVSKEDIKGYYRPRLSEMLSNDNLSYESIAIKKDKWFEDNKVGLLLNKCVSKIDACNKKVIFTDGEEMYYTKLIIAIGSEAFVPPFAGKDKKGVFTLRYAKDVNAIKDYAKDKRTAAVIGGGILGLEAASELSKLGLKVTVIELAKRILPMQLDEATSRLYENIIEKAGITVKKGLASKEIIGDERVKGVLLDNGEVVDADLIIVSAGVRVNTKITEGSNIETNRAIVVNNKMETSVRDIYACGDCAECSGINYALWREAQEQGKTAGINAAGGNSIYNNITPSTILSAFGTRVFSIGDVGCNQDVQYETYENVDGDNIKKLFFLDGKLKGGILIGDTSKMGALTSGVSKGESKEVIIDKIIS